MAKLEDLTGHRYGRLVVVERAPSRVTPNGTVQTMWKCKCDCGNEIIARANGLKTGNTQSCGCRKTDILLQRSTKHGGRRSGNTDRLYVVWESMLSRCRNDRDYAGRGISVCDEWKDYAKFREWAKQSGYNENAEPGKCTIDRIDNNGNYSPDNCRWVDMLAQANNTRKNRLVEYNGETKTASEWARIAGITSKAFYFRLNSGWTMDDIMTTPHLKANRKFDRNSPLSRKATINGETKSILDWCDIYHIDNNLATLRIRNGWSAERAVSTPPRKCGAAKK